MIELQFSLTILFKKEENLKHVFALFLSGGCVYTGMRLTSQATSKSPSASCSVSLRMEHHPELEAVWVQLCHFADLRVLLE